MSRLWCNLSLVRLLKSLNPTGPLPKTTSHYPVADLQTHGLRKAGNLRCCGSHHGPAGVINIPLVYVRNCQLALRQGQLVISLTDTFFLFLTPSSISGSELFPAALPCMFYLSRGNQARASKRISLRQRLSQGHVSGKCTCLLIASAMRKQPCVSVVAPNPLRPGLPRLRRQNTQTPSHFIWARSWTPARPFWNQSLEIQRQGWKNLGGVQF